MINQYSFTEFLTSNKKRRSNLDVDMRVSISETDGPILMRFSSFKRQFPCDNSQLCWVNVGAE